MPDESQLTFGLDGGILTSAPSDLVALPDLVMSDNTRLSVVRGTVSAAPSPELLLATALGTECGGIIPAGRLDSSVAFLSGIGGGTQRIAGRDVAPLQSTIQPPATQNAYLPADLVSAGAVPGTLETRPPVVCVSGGVRVFASMRYNPLVTNGVGIYVTALDAAGRVVISPQLVAALGAEPTPFEYLVSFWLALTANPTGGLRLWYVRGTDVYRRTLSISGLTLTVGAEVLHSATAALLGRNVDVAAGEGSTAWLLHSSPSLSSTYLDKVDVAANTYTRITLSADAGIGGVGVETITYGGVPYVAVAFGAGVNLFSAVYRADTNALVWSSSTNTPKSEGYVAVQFLVAPDGTAYVVCASSDDAGTAGTYFEARNLLTGVLAGVSAKSTHYMRLVDRGATVTLNVTERRPVFTLERCYDYAAAADVSSPHYLADPSLELWTVTLGVPSQLHTAPIARYGVDMALRGRSTLAQFPPWLGSDTIAVDGKRVVCTYLAENYELSRVALGHIPRFVEVDLTPRQPRYALDAAGVALIAAAQPATWDGVEVVEAGPLHRPRVTVAPTGGTGPDLTGTYYFRAVYSWRDAAGQLHRSAPSLPAAAIGTVGAPIKPQVSVTVPDTLRNGISQEEFDITLYQAGPLVSATEATSSTYFARTDYLPSSKADVWTFAAIQTTPSNETTPLYTTEQGDEELAAEAPPALYDVAMVGSRAIGIDAELRRKLRYTKRRAEGLALEWNAVLAIDFSPSAGDLLAVAELDGKPVVFAAGGVFVLDGDGLDNTGQSGGYAERRLADITCTSRESVVRFPGGVFFHAGSRFAMLVAGGGGLRVIDQIDARTLTVGSAFVVQASQELVLLCGPDAARVFNFALERFTTWSSLGQQSVAAAVSPSRALTFASGLRVVELAQPRASVLELRTGWVQPAGPQGDLAIREVLVHGIAGAHSLQILVHLDYAESTAAVDVTYSAVELAAAALPNGRYTLRVALTGCIARALQVRLIATRDPALTSGDVFRPLSVTATLGVSSAVLRRHLPAGLK